MPRYLILLFKIGLSTALVWYAFSKIDISHAFSLLRAIPWYILATAITVLFIQFAFAGMRLMELLEILGTRCRFVASFDAVLIGAFFSQTLISFVGGDAMRVLHIVRRNVPLGVAARAVLFDRIFGFVGLIILILLGLPFLLRIIADPEMRASILVLVLIGVGGFVTFLLIDMMMPRTLRKWRILHFAADASSIGLQITKSGKKLFGLLGLSFFIQLLNVLVVFVITRGLSIEISFVSCLVLFPPVLFLSMMPISFAGWGIREGAMVVALALVGVSSSKSLALSICFGLCVAAVSIPGGIIWFMTRGRKDVIKPSEIGYD
jgi:uncharacterized membrane protein YbhN (UPF0104 family)